MLATTSSKGKAVALKKLEVAHIINHKDIPNRGKTARALTPNGVGLDYIVEVAGEECRPVARRNQNLISCVDSLTMLEGEKSTSLLQTLIKIHKVRGALVDSLQLFEDIKRTIEAAKIKPIVNQTTFQVKNLLQSSRCKQERKKVKIKGERHVTVEAQKWCPLFVPK